MNVKTEMVAQSVEQVPFKHWVAGSIPAHLTSGENRVTLFSKNTGSQVVKI